MWRAILFLASIVAASGAQARTLLGQYEGWGAFREPPGHCFALAEPADRGAGGRPYIAISRTVGGGPPRLQVVTGRPQRPDTPMRLEIGAQSFVLRGANGGDARADARIIAAIRRADRLRVLGVDRLGRAFHEDYALPGAPSAIDAAILGCLRQ